MSKVPFLHRLFDAHATDLSIVLPDLQDIFVCPICLYKYTQYAIDRDELSDGHVWWTNLRLPNGVADRMSVLLCKDCNNRAGSREDKQAQLMGRIRKGDGTGNLFGKRIVRLAGDTDKPIRVLVDITGISPSGFNVSGPVDNAGNWVLASPDDQARFKELFKNQEWVKTVIYHHPELLPELVPAGWITSAYLMAFYALGYRYILQKSLNPVRDYIRRSFVQDTGLGELNDDDFGVNTLQGEFFPDPELKLIFPFEHEKPVYVQVSCLTFQVRLPFRFSLSAFQALPKPKPGPGLIGYQATVNCTKTVVHHCHFDDLMGDAQPRFVIDPPP